MNNDQVLAIVAAILYVPFTENTQGRYKPEDAVRDAAELLQLSGCFKER